VNTVMNLRVTYNAGKFLSSCIIGGFLRRTQFHEVSLVSVGLHLSPSGKNIIQSV
jgi:hypothetical protein